MSSIKRSLLQERRRGREGEGGREGGEGGREGGEGGKEEKEGGKKEREGGKEEKEGRRRRRERRRRGREGERIEDMKKRGRGRVKFRSGVRGLSITYLGTLPTPTALGMSPLARLLGEAVPTSGSNLTYRLWRARALGYKKGEDSINLHILSTVRRSALPHQC